MKKGTLLIQFFFLIFFVIVISVNSTEHDISPADFGQADRSSNIELFKKTIEGKGSGNFRLSTSQTVNLPEGKTITVSGDVKIADGEIQYADNMEFEGGSFRNIRNFRRTADGYVADSVERLQQNDVIITKGEGISYSKGVLKAKHVDSVSKGNSVTTNVDNLVIGTKISVERADSLLSSGITISNIENTEFLISDKEIAMNSKNGSTLHITGKGYIEADFEAFSDDSEIKISKEKSEYEIKNGRLNYSSNDYTDSVETNSTAKIEIDESGYGFRCMLLGIKSTYWYYDRKDIRKDFGVNIPSYGNEYRLCIRRLKNLNNKKYDGLIDFIDKNVFLSNIVNYLRYPLKNNQISSLLSNFVYVGLKNVKTFLIYDKDLLFLTNASIKNILENKNQVTITNPNNYFVIKEMELEDGKIHRIIELNKLERAELTQDLISNYESDSLNAKISVKDNILAQQGGNGRITVYSSTSYRKA